MIRFWVGHAPLVVRERVIPYYPCGFASDFFCAICSGKVRMRIKIIYPKVQRTSLHPILGKQNIIFKCLFSLYLKYLLDSRKNKTSGICTVFVVVIQSWYKRLILLNRFIHAAINFTFGKNFMACFFLIWQFSLENSLKSNQKN